MKISIRTGIFETNSSSVHSITISKKSDYKDFEDGKLWYKKGDYPNYNGNFLPEDEAVEWNINRLKETLDDPKYFNAYREKKNFWEAWYKVYGDNADSYDRYDDFTGDNDICSYEFYMNWEDYWEDNQYESFEQEYTSEHGDELIAWGYVGTDY